MAARTIRIASLVLPSALAARLAMPNERLLSAAAPVLVMLWVVMAGALVMRLIEARDQRPRTRSPWAAIDVLTATGTSVMWLGAIALILSGTTRWASLSVVGILGLGTMYVVTTWTAIMACGTDRWKTPTIAREVVPEIATEGEPLREEVKLAGIKIPAGMRLFITGRAMQHGAVSRYVVGAESSGGEVNLACELGPALRGEHRAEPLAMWFSDVFGLTRSPLEYRTEVAFSVLPKVTPVDGAKQLLGSGGDAAVAHSTHKLPTEGTFRIREYVPGDDTRRIHWVRSAQQDQLVVRLPDEIPPADPAVRLILDNELPGIDTTTTRAPDELLDAMVRVWLGIGKALAEGGTRVTLVTSLDLRGAQKKVERQLFTRTSREAAKLGMRVTWQSDVVLDQLISSKKEKQIVVTCRPRRIAGGEDIAWVIVPESAWTTAEPPIPEASALAHAYPSGAPENRRSHRQRERKRIERMWQDRLVFTHLVGWTDWTKVSGGHVARPNNGRISLGVIP